MSLLNGYFWTYDSDALGKARAFYGLSRQGLEGGHPFPFSRYEIAVIQTASGNAFVAVLVLTDTAGDDSLHVVAETEKWFAACGASGYDEYESITIRGDSIETSLDHRYQVLQSMGPLRGRAVPWPPPAASPRPSAERTAGTCRRCGALLADEARCPQCGAVNWEFLGMFTAGGLIAAVGGLWIGSPFWQALVLLFGALFLCIAIGLTVELLSGSEEAKNGVVVALCAACCVGAAGFWLQDTAGRITVGLLGLVFLVALVAGLVRTSSGMLQKVRSASPPRQPPKARVEKASRALVREVRTPAEILGAVLGKVVGVDGLCAVIGQLNEDGAGNLGSFFAGQSEPDMLAFVRGLNTASPVVRQQVAEALNAGRTPTLGDEEVMAPEEPPCVEPLTGLDADREAAAEALAAVDPGRPASGWKDRVAGALDAVAQHGTEGTQALLALLLDGLVQSGDGLSASFGPAAARKEWCKKRCLAEALGRAGDRGVVPALAGLLNARCPDPAFYAVVQPVLAWALLKIGDARGRQALRDAHGNPRSSPATVELLVRAFRKRPGASGPPAAR